MNLMSFDRSQITAQGTLTRTSFLAAPAFILAYGVVRLVGGPGGRDGPGLAWTAGHALFLVGLLLFGVVLFGLRRQVGATVGGQGLTANAAIVVAGAGLIAFVRVAVIDLVVGLRAADHAAMSTLFGQLKDFPGVLPGGFYAVGPLLFEVGLLALVVQLAVQRPRRLPVSSPVLLFLGVVLIGINLDLLPLGAALFWLALAPAALVTRPALLHQPVGEGGLEGGSESAHGSSPSVRSRH
jgi:hypothetical protein